MDYSRALELAKTQQKIILPPLIESDEYEMIMNLLMLARNEGTFKTIEIYISGYGGSADLCFGIANWVAQDNYVDGYLIGSGGSCHAFIWASCPNRYFYKNSFLKVHPVMRSQITNADLATLQQELDGNKKFDQAAIDTYARISNKPVKWWEQKYKNLSNSAYTFSASELIELEMGAYIP